MTTERDPPRLRTLDEELPSDLLLALRAPGETATAAEVAELVRRVRAETTRHDGAMHRAVVPRRPAARGRAASLVLSFSLGAAAGVAVSGAGFVIERSRGSEPTKQTAPSARPQPVRASQPIAPAPVPTSTLEVPPEAPPESSQRRAPEPARFPTPNPELASPPATPSGSLAANRDELALLARAQSSLDANPRQALALTGEHERRFPHGALVQEREVVAIDALLRIGRRGEAAIRAVRFHREFPASVHTRRLDVLLGAAGGSARNHN